MSSASDVSAGPAPPKRPRGGGPPENVSPATVPPEPVTPQNGRARAAAPHPAPVEVPATAIAGLEGLIEVYGRQEAGDCWIFGGWISRAWMAVKGARVTATFERGEAAADAWMTFYERGDLRPSDIGFMLVLPTPQRRLGPLRRLELRRDNAAVEIVPASDIRELPDRGISERAEAILAVSVSRPDLEAISLMVSRRFVGEGYIDAYGYHAPSAGWFVCGWVSNDWIAKADPVIQGMAVFEHGTCDVPVVLAYYGREDIHGKGLGILLHLPTANKNLGRLLSLTLRAGRAVVLVKPAGEAGIITGDAIVASFQGLLERADPGPGRDVLRDLAARAAYDGRDTVATLREPIAIGVDLTIVCATDSVVICGWLLARPGAVKALRLRSSDHMFPIDLDRHILWSDRNDVIEAVGRDQGFDDPRCGVVIRAPTGREVTGDLYLEIETLSGGIGFKQLPPARVGGLAAMKRLLGVLDTQFTDVDAIYDHILGPAVGALNAERLSAPQTASARRFGPPIAAPRHSVIIPLYGRIDFMEAQMALFATLGVGRDVEIIYVLDDPPRTRETQFLADSIYQRFRVPFRLICLTRNVGFAPANNIGARTASGEFICLLNSDVFPTTGDWLERLAARLEADPGLGVVGPLLLFEDDSVQHQGLTFKPLSQFGNWSFPQHRRKGFRPPATGALTRELAITGACMVLRREHYLALGGLDEAFAIGDFEDTDLCFKLRREGLAAAVDLGVVLHHLERKSQASSANVWRTNLTLYNAWVHQRRWGPMIASLAEPS